MVIDKQLTKQQELAIWNLLDLRIPKMTVEDDPEVFLESFKRVAMATSLDKAKWAVRIGVLLVGLAPAA